MTTPHVRSSNALLWALALAAAGCAPLSPELQHRPDASMPTSSTTAPTAAPMVAPCPAGRTAMRSESLYFGANKPSGTVTPQDWSRFLAQVVTPRFPSGLTVWQADGQWRGASGQIERERSRVVSIIHAGSELDEQHLAAVIATYKSLFSQEAVLRVSSAVCISF